MRLQILIPQYKETEEVISNLLNSILIQQGVNFNDIEVLIMNDGTDIHLSEDLLEIFPFKVKYFLEEHIGVSAIRQKLLETADADYVMFCDADDMFVNSLGLFWIFQALAKSPCDVLVSPFFQEIRQRINKNQIFIDYQLKGDMQKTGSPDGVFVHGKVYRREYLMENGIKWDPELTANEDSYFNTLAIKMTDKAQYCGIPFYLWKYNDNSVTRSTPGWILTNYPELMKSNEKLVAQFLQRDRLDLAQTYVCQMVYNAYFTIHNDIWTLPQNKSYYNHINSLMKKYIKVYGQYFEAAPQEVKDRIYALQRTLKSHGKEVKLAFKDWFKFITK